MRVPRRPMGADVSDAAAPAGTAGQEPLPRVVVVCDVMSITPMVLAEAASGLCRIVWVVDGGDPVMGPMVRLLRRLGDVVDRAGLDADAVGQRSPPTNPAVS